MLAKEMAAHSSFSCLKNSMDRGRWQVQSVESSKYFVRKIKGKGIPVDVGKESLRLGSGSWGLYLGLLMMGRAPD